MFVRIVKMTFKKDTIEAFLKHFDANKEKIRSVKGCSLMELYQDKKESSVFFTYSHWNCEEDLENYRNSNLFRSVWADTKVLFSDKPEAWSVDVVDK